MSEAPRHLELETPWTAAPMWVPALAAGLLGWVAASLLGGLLLPTVFPELVGVGCGLLVVALAGRLRRRLRLEVRDERLHVTSGHDEHVVALAAVVEAEVLDGVLTVRGGAAPVRARVPGGLFEASRIEGFLLEHLPLRERTATAEALRSGVVVEAEDGSLILDLGEVYDALAWPLVLVGAAIASLAVWMALPWGLVVMVELVADPVRPEVLAAARGIGHGASLLLGLAGLGAYVWRDRVDLEVTRTATAIEVLARTRVRESTWRVPLRELREARLEGQFLVLETDGPTHRIGLPGRGRKVREAMEGFLAAHRARG